MALYNEILVGRYNRALQKLLSMKGQASMVQLANEAMAVFPFYWGVENRYLEAWERFAFTQSFAAGGAGNTNQFQIRNPGGSNVIIVVEKISATSGAQGNTINISHGATAADLANVTATTNARFDSRSRPQATAIISNAQAASSNLAAIADTLAYATNTYGTAIFFENQEIPLLPGDALRMNGSSANIAENYIYQWRERFLEDSERT